MKTYSIDGIKLISRAMDERRDFVSWANVWLGVKVLIAMEVAYYAASLPIYALVVAFIAVWAIYEINRF